MSQEESLHIGPEDDDAYNGSGGNTKEKRGGENYESSCHVNPRIVLAPDHPNDADDGMTKTANAAGELKRPYF